MVVADSKPEHVATAGTVRYQVLGVFSLLAGLTYFDRICISQAIVPMGRDLGLDDGSKGLVFSAFTLAYALFEIPTGRLGDAIGPRRVLFRVVVWWSVFTALTGWAWSLPALLLIRFAFGAGEAGAFPNIARALTRWFPPRQRGRAQGVIWLTSRLGGAIAPGLTAALIATVGWRWTFVVFGALGLLWAVPFRIWYRDEPEDHPAVTEEERAWIRSWRGEKAGPSHEAGAPWGRILSNPSVWGMALATFGSAFGWYFFITWLPTYLEQVRHLPVKSASWIAGLPLALGVVGCGFGGWLGDRLARLKGGDRWARRAVGVTCYLLAGTCFWVGVNASNAAVAVALMATASFFNDIPQSGLWAAIMDIGERHAGSVAGFVNLLSGAGAFLSPIWFGFLLKSGHGWSAALATAGAGFVMASVCWLFVDPTRTVGEPPSELVEDAI